MEAAKGHTAGRPNWTKALVLDHSMRRKKDDTRTNTTPGPCSQRFSHAQTQAGVGDSPTKTPPMAWDISDNV